MLRRSLAILALAMAGAAPAAAQAPEAPAESRTCLPLSQVQETRVRGDRVIDFVLRDGSVWRNTLPYQCPQLGAQQTISYQTSINQLCRQDVITVLIMTGGNPLGARCGLGTFQRQPPRPRKGE